MDRDSAGGADGNQTYEPRRAESSRTLAAELLERVGLDRHLVEAVDFSGPDIVLPSSYRITEAAQALVAAVSAAVADIARTASPPNAGQDSAMPPIVVDSIETCVAFQSERHLQQPGGTQGWDDLAGHYETADGHIQFHTNFPHHRQALLTVTGLPPESTRDEVAAVVIDAQRFELEQRMAEAGGIASALRTIDEWRAHPHSAHMADHPPVQVSPPSSPGNGASTNTDRQVDRNRPLAGLRVLDLTRVIAGPVCTRTLAAYGADVLRLGGPDLPVVTSILPDATLGKRFAHCDITTDDGRQTVLALAERADIVVSGYRPGALDRHGVGHNDLLAVNPGLITASLSAFGTDGPWGGKRGFDSITQTATGIVSTETAAFGSDGPRPLPCQFLDHGSGFLLTLGVLSALSARNLDGGHRHVEVSLLATRNWLESLGPADPTAGHGLTTDQIAVHLLSRSSDYGPIRHARHPGRIAGVPARWDRGPVKPGRDLPGW